MELLFDDSGVSRKDIEATAANLLEYQESLKDVYNGLLYEVPEASVNLPTDADMVERVVQMANAKRAERLRYIFVIGIGGSNLGTKAIYDALDGSFDKISPARKPKMVFVDTNDPEGLQRTISFIDSEIKSLDELAVCAISKSGGTTETIANTEWVMQALQKRFERPESRLVVITGEDSAFASRATELGIDQLHIPKLVGGRYSVFSPVGLYPLALAGYDIESLMEGARSAKVDALNDSIDHNPSLASASILLLNRRAGRSVNDNFVFHPELESLGKWYRQLMGESIGKENDIDGNQVFEGLIPTVSVGSIDLHSVGQLYLGGPKEKITTFISTRRNQQGPKLAGEGERLFPELVPMINGKSANDIMKAIYGGVIVAYRKNDRAFMEVVLDEVSEYSLGYFMQFKMIEMMFLGKLLNVNPFDQPNVESYKVETKNILENN